MCELVSICSLFRGLLIFQPFTPFEWATSHLRWRQRGVFFADLAQVDWPSPLKMIFPPRPWNPRIPRTFPSSQLRAHSRAHLPTQIECEIIGIPFHTQPAREIVTQRPKKSPFVQVPPSHWGQSGGLLDLEAHNFLARSHWAIKLNVQLKRSATNG
jgi:hypothetical protein